MRSFVDGLMVVVLLITLYRLIRALRENAGRAPVLEPAYFALLAVAEALLIAAHAVDWQWVVLFGVGAIGPYGRRVHRPSGDSPGDSR